MGARRYVPGVGWQEVGPVRRTSFDDAPADDDVEEIDLRADVPEVKTRRRVRDNPQA